VTADDPADDLDLADLVKQVMLTQGLFAEHPLLPVALPAAGAGRVAG
jgi:hypothetical protein